MHEQLPLLSPRERRVRGEEAASAPAALIGEGSVRGEEAASAPFPKKLIGEEGTREERKLLEYEALSCYTSMKP
jgi:hypothetical protein